MRRRSFTLLLLPLVELTTKIAPEPILTHNLQTEAKGQGEG